MISKLLDDVGDIPPRLYDTILYKVLYNTYALRLYLRGLRQPKDCLRILRVELLTKNRLSYIQRILGRYHTLSRIYELEDLDHWVKKRTK